MQMNRMNNQFSPRAGSSKTTQAFRSSSTLCAWIAVITLTMGAFAQQITIKGTVVNAKTGQPIRKATVELIPREPSSSQQQLVTQTDKLGKFHFPHALPGIYNLVSSKTGFLNGHYGSRQYVADLLTVSDERPPSDIVVKLSPKSTISGRVLDDDGDPLINLTVLALRLEYREGSASWETVAQSQTNDQGDYRLSMLPPGRYVVRTVSRYLGAINTRTPKALSLPDRPDTIYPSTYHVGSGAELEKSAISVRMGDEVPGVDIVIAPAPAFRIRGRIERPSDVPVVIAWVSTDRDTRTIAAHLPAGESDFELNGLVPGSYTIKVQSEDTPVEAFAQQSIEITDRSVDSLVISLEGASDVVGTVTIDGAVPTTSLNDMKVSLRGDAIYYLPTATVAPDGAILLKDVVPSSFSVDLKGVPQSLYVKDVLYNNATVPGGTNVALSLGAQLQVQLAAGAANIAGVAMDKDQRPVAGATIAIVPHTGQPRIVHSDDDGTFSLAGLAPGKYLLVGGTDVRPGAFLDPIVREQHGVHQQQVVLSAGEQKSLSLSVITNTIW